MKNLFNLFFAAVLVASFMACSSTKSTAGSDIDSAINTNAAGTDTTKTNLNTPEGPTGMASGFVQTTAPDTVNAIKFIQEAGNAGMKEVELGKLALKDGASPGVKAYGAIMVSDHERANAELKILASSRNVKLVMDDETKASISSLKKLSGADFDKAYIKMMLEDHTAAIDLFDVATRSSDEQIKAYATKYLPTLKEHHKKAMALSNQKAN